MEFGYTFDEKKGVDRVQSRDLTLGIRRLGCEMVELVRHHSKFGDVPVIWRSGDLEPPDHGWANHATLLFPIVGRLKGMRSVTSDGREVWFERGHGFARISNFALAPGSGKVELEERGEGFYLEYKLSPKKEPIPGYPWRFELFVRYTIHGPTVTQAITVVNQDQRPMPFQVGWHPGFRAPFVSGEKSECHLDLPPARIKRVHNNDECFLTGRVSDFEAGPDFEFDEQGLERTYMFDLSDVAPGNRVVSLWDRSRDFGVEVHFPDYPHLGIWSDAGAGFICIEPWQGMDDHVDQEPFDRKFGIVVLEPGARMTKRAWFTIT